MVIWVVKERVWVSSRDGGEEAGRGGCRVEGVDGVEECERR